MRSTPGGRIFLNNRNRGYVRRAGFYNRYRAPAWARRTTALRRKLGVEKKFTDNFYEDNSIGLDWQTVALSASDNSATQSTANLLMIGQGNGPQQRIGRKILVTDLYVQGVVRMPAQPNTATPAPTTCRVVIYLDKQCNGAAANTGNIYNFDYLDDDPPTDPIYAFRNLENQHRFKILCDRWVDLVPQAGSGADATAEWSGDQKIFTKYLKNLNLPIEYDQTGTTGAVATIRSNNLGLIVCGSNAANLSAVKFNVRVRFTDL